MNKDHLFESRHFVYAIFFDGGIAKIGRTCRLAIRFRHMIRQCETRPLLFAYVQVDGRLQAQQVEKGLHYAFSSRLLGHEWFTFNTRDPDDRAAFNAGWRSVFARYLPGRGWERRLASSILKLLDVDTRRQARIDMRRSNWKRRQSCAYLKSVSVIGQ